MEVEMEMKPLTNELLTSILHIDRSSNQSQSHSKVREKRRKKKEKKENYKDLFFTRRSNNSFSEYNVHFHPSSLI